MIYGLQGPSQAENIFRKATLPEAVCCHCPKQHHVKIERVCVRTPRCLATQHELAASCFCSHLCFRQVHSTLEIIVLTALGYQVKQS